MTAAWTEDRIAAQKQTMKARRSQCAPDGGIGLICRQCATPRFFGPGELHLIRVTGGPSSGESLSWDRDCCLWLDAPVEATTMRVPAEGTETCRCMHGAHPGEVCWLCGCADHQESDLSVRRALRHVGLVH